MSVTDPMLQDAARLMAMRQQSLTSAPPPGAAFLARSASLFCPGLGHIIAGQIHRGMTWLLVLLTLVAANVYALLDQSWFPVLGYLFVALVVCYFGQAAAASRCAKRSSATMLWDASMRYAVGAALLLGTLLWQHQAVLFCLDNLFQVGHSPTPSMSPTIAPGDYFLVVRHYDYSRFDIIAMKAAPNDSGITEFTKRIVGLPGEKLELVWGDVLINDHALPLLPQSVHPLPIDNLYQTLASADPVNAGNGCWGRPIQLLKDEYFVLGDNSPVSYDSRLFPSLDGRQPGAVAQQRIIGRVIATIWPLSRWRVFDAGYKIPAAKGR